MGKWVCHYVWNDFVGDKIYDTADMNLNQDGLLEPMRHLRDHLRRLGVELRTQDLIPPEDADLILLENCPVDGAYERVMELKKLGKPMLLNASESIFIMPENNDDRILNLFDRVFTYQDQRLADGRFRKYNYTYDLPTSVPRGDFAKKGLICTIAGNKRVRHAGELYSERVRLILWFEKHHPGDFGLYGRGWDRPHKAAAPWFHRKVLFKWPFRPFFAKPFSSYRGEVARKAEVLARYRFCLCFENAADVSGYITEKMFDAMMAGCVPVYRGADNVAEHVPRTCFIDYRDFASYAELHAFIASMTAAEHAAYVDAAEAFFNSPEADPFRLAFHVDTIAREVCALLDVPFVAVGEGNDA